jgi:hypothetical protein
MEWPAIATGIRASSAVTRSHLGQVSQHCSPHTEGTGYQATTGTATIPAPRQNQANPQAPSLCASNFEP